MNIREFFLRLAILPILLFSANAYAVPILHVNATRVIGSVGEVYFLKYSDGMSHSEADEMLIPANRLWNGDIVRNDLLSGHYSREFILPYGFYGFGLAFATQLLGSDLASLTILDVLTADDTRVNSDTGSGGDADEVVDFLATLGIAMEDWLAAEKNPHANSQSDQSTPSSFIPAITRYGLNNECLQQQKPGLRENLCPQAGGLAGAGARGGAGIIAGKASGDFGSGIGNPGIGNPGIGSPGSPGLGIGDPGIGSNGPGYGNDGPDIGGNNPGSGSGGSGGRDVVTVPEPTTLALIGFGIASMYMVRRRKKIRAKDFM